MERDHEIPAADCELQEISMMPWWERVEWIAVTREDAAEIGATMIPNPLRYITERERPDGSGHDD